MVMTKQESAAKAREARAAKLEAAADTSKPDDKRDLQAEAQAAYEEVTGQAKPDPAAYKYIGGLNEVIVIQDGTAYEFRVHALVMLPHAEPGLDGHPDFKRVPLPKPEE